MDTRKPNQALSNRTEPPLPLLANSFAVAQFDSFGHCLMKFAMFALAMMFLTACNRSDAPDNATRGVCYSLELEVGEMLDRYEDMKIGRSPRERFNRVGSQGSTEGKELAARRVRTGQEIINFAKSNGKYSSAAPLVMKVFLATVRAQDLLLFDHSPTKAQMAIAIAAIQHVKHVRGQLISVMPQTRPGLFDPFVQPLVWP